PALEGAEREAIGLEVIGLALIHRDEQPRRHPVPDETRPHHRGRAQGYEFTSLHPLGMPPRTESSILRAWGATALSGYSRISSSSAVIASPCLPCRTSTRAS